MSLLPVRMKMSQSKRRGLSGHNIFLIISLWGIFFRRSRAADSAAPGQILPNFEPIRDLMVVRITIKNEEDPLKMKTVEWSQHFPQYNPMGAICCYGNQSSDQI